MNHIYQCIIAIFLWANVGWHAVSCFRLLVEVFWGNGRDASIAFVIRFLWLLVCIAVVICVSILKVAA